MGSALLGSITVPSTGHDGDDLNPVKVLPAA